MSDPMCDTSLQDPAADARYTVRRIHGDRWAVCDSSAALPQLPLLVCASRLEARQEAARRNAQAGGRL